MGHSCYVAGYPPPTTHPDETEVNSLSEALSPGADALPWGCETFEIPNSLSDGVLLCPVKIQHDMQRVVLRDLAQCAALAIRLSSLRPDWVWSVTDDHQLLTIEVGEVWLKDGSAVTVCDEDAPHDASISRDPELDAALRGMLHRVLGAKVLEALGLGHLEDVEDPDLVLRWNADDLTPPAEGARITSLELRCDRDETHRYSIAVGGVNTSADAIEMRVVLSDRAGELAAVIDTDPFRSPTKPEFELGWSTRSTTPPEELGKLECFVRARTSSPLPTVVKHLIEPPRRDNDRVRYRCARFVAAFEVEQQWAFALDVEWLDADGDVHARERIMRSPFTLGENGPGSQVLIFDRYLMASKGEDVIVDARSTLNLVEGRWHRVLDVHLPGVGTQSSDRSTEGEEAAQC